MNSRIKKGKSRTLFRHARQRFIERYGIDLTPVLHEEICDLIKKGIGTLIEKQSLRVSVWEVDCQGQKIKVCYDRKRHLIITVLPEPGTPGYVENFEWI